MNDFLKHDDLRLALSELRDLFANLKGVVVRATVFGSSIKGGVEKSNDIDLVVQYVGRSFAEVRQQLLDFAKGRELIVENAEFSYSNHPRWPDSKRPPFHILLYANQNKLTEKVRNGLSNSIEVTHLVIDETD